MLNDKLQKALNQQINLELYSSYIYLSMSAWFEDINLTGFAQWMKIQSQEELLHVLKLFDFVNDCNGRVLLQAIAAPPTEWKSPLDAFQNAYQHEQHVTRSIYNLMDLAVQEKDHAVQALLQWFVNEQVEEEATARELVEKLKRIEGAPAALFLIDQELAGRTLSTPAE